MRVFAEKLNPAWDYILGATSTDAKTSLMDPSSDMDYQVVSPRIPECVLCSGYR